MEDFFIYDYGTTWKINFLKYTGLKQIIKSQEYNQNKLIKHVHPLFHLEFIFLSKAKSAVILCIILW